MKLIQANELSRWYGIVMGLNNVTFEIEAGLTGHLVITTVHAGSAPDGRTDELQVVKPWKVPEVRGHGTEPVHPLLALGRSTERT